MATLPEVAAEAFSADAESLVAANAGLLAATSTGVPHFVQNFVSPERGTPHFVQKRFAAADSVEFSRRAPHFVQNASRWVSAAPH
ncbi:MAG TPA: hypothetical protein VKT50_03470 [Candidatus Acidoferrales bacterium]|nr:hypothetical protein [Candidatus Acidoferrales bacterium]